MNGAEAVLACLRAEGIKYIFGNPGTTEVPLLDVLSETADITYLVTLQESVAMGMADGYARSGGRIGLVNVHTAAGTSNCLGGMYSAWREKTPLLVTAGCKDSRMLGRECFSEVPDFAGLPRQFTKWSWQILRSDRLAEGLLRGIRTALTPPRGPVFLVLCEDLLCQDVPVQEIISQVPRTSLACAGDPEALQEAARILAGARRPLLIAGTEIAERDALAEAVALADLLALPVMTEGRDALMSLNFPHTHPSFRGDFEPASPYAREADVVLGIGCRMFTQKSYSPEPDILKGVKIIHLHSDPHELARLYPEEVSILTDAKRGLQDLQAALQPLLDKDAQERIRERRQVLQGEQEDLKRRKEEEIAAAWGKLPLSLPRLVRELQAAVARDAIIVDESTRSSRALLKYYEFAVPGTYYRSAAGVLGWGVPAALGVKLANPGRQVVAFVGDGSMNFSIQSLWTAASYNIPVVVVICNNRQYKAVKDASVQYKGNAVRTGKFVASDLSAPPIDFCKVAEGYGVWARQITKPEDIQPALKEALDLGKPAVLEMLLV